MLYQICLLYEEFKHDKREIYEINNVNDQFIHQLFWYTTPVRLFGRALEKKLIMVRFQSYSRIIVKDPFLQPYNQNINSGLWVYSLVDWRKRLWPGFSPSLCLPFMTTSPLSAFQKSLPFYSLGRIAQETLWTKSPFKPS